MNIVFISSLQYPNGGAAVNRHLALAKGLKEHGNEVIFILTGEQSSYRDFSLFNFASFHMTFQKVAVKNRYCNNILSKLKSISSAIKLINKLNRSNKIDVLVLLDTMVIDLFPFITVAKKKNIKILHERTEYPLVVERKGLFGKINFIIYKTFVIRCFDGLYVITRNLQNYFKSKMKFNNPIIVINMVVEPERFFNLESYSDDTSKILAYCGTMNGNKDGIETLIRAFGKARIEYAHCKDLKLMLIGDISDQKLFQNLKSVSTEFNCTNWIEFTGKVDRDKIPLLLSSANALILARPANLQAHGGFPTKLGEYLSTGKPVIVTKVGEICNFLIDSENAFLAIPDDVNSIANQIGNVFQNYENAKVIGRRGKKLIYREFNYKIQSKKLHLFFELIVGK